MGASYFCCDITMMDRLVCEVCEAVDEDFVLKWAKEGSCLEAVKCGWFVGFCWLCSMQGDLV